MSQVAGRLAEYLPQWQRITKDPYVLQCIEGYQIRFDSPPVQSRCPKPVFDEKTLGDLGQAISELLKKGAIEQCQPTPKQFLSSYFLVPKKEGLARFVLNLKSLNKFIKTDHFKMEDLRTAMKLVDKGSFMTSIDLKDAYFLVKVHNRSRKYLRFIFQNQLFQFTCLPFGLSLSPFVFTKILKPVVATLRSKGFLSCIYLDDILCIASSKELCRGNTQNTIQALEGLGFVLNQEKCCLEPDTRRKYLGFIIDSMTMTVEPTPEKRQSLGCLVRKWSKRSKCSIRELAHLIGSLVACCPGIEYSKAHIKLFEIAEIEALTESEGDFDAKMCLPAGLQADFRWWAENLTASRRKIRNQNYDLEIFSDASTTGWRASCNGESTHGFWSTIERIFNINHLELLAAFYALKCFAKRLENKQILLRIDNTTALAYINKMGGTHVLALDSIAKQIWGWCEARQLWLYASYIPSKENVEADRESRVENDTTEWELHNAAFNSIVRKFGVPDIDLFASRINTKCETYCSWHRDPEANLIDAFTFHWAPWSFYAFPPFALVLKTLRKIIQDEATGIMVVPRWTSQPWYPLFASLLVEDPLFLGPATDLLSSPFRLQGHPMAKSLILVAGRLSGRRSKTGEFLKLQSTY